MAHQIDAIILLDRSVDFLTPLCTQLTYEGLIDEVYKIKYSEETDRQTDTDERERNRHMYQNQQQKQTTHTHIKSKLCFDAVYMYFYQILIVCSIKPSYKDKTVTFQMARCVG